MRRILERLGGFIAELKTGVTNSRPASGSKTLINEASVRNAAGLKYLWIRNKIIRSYQTGL